MDVEQKTTSNLNTLGFMAENKARSQSTPRNDQARIKTDAFWISSQLKNPQSDSLF
ncbi:hypothetical protein RO3G_16864 [Rhizopus delemar RA 99-880]|uniref:Uncharacterized protein n=1 Tax=Rhizopus delemar (strain RA 99-880 / ATCC MYA-4621 / FGSC 9543 / NRRL 43880) TaxID=246409 RepID=I1CUM3_RHIO9|nr:hypothetical protein RO3G_16864 [Rhizopus delemar RA 99-880]|eukprot:EIE92153.1 hypothetical protein RO3G_16864 [Rhizopus delemar RA 99-880]